MKSSTSFLCALLLGGAVVATPAAGQDSPLANRAKVLTQQMAEKAYLNEGQYVKVKRLNLQLLTTTETLKKQLAADPEALDTRLAEVQNNYEWDLACILRPRQMLAYDQAKASMTAFNGR